MQKLRAAGSRGSGPVTSTVSAASSAGGPTARGPSISPSAKRKPSASPSSSPGVRMVTASGRAVDADLERLLHRHRVLEPGGADGGMGAVDVHLGHTG